VKNSYFVRKLELCFSLEKQQLISNSFEQKRKLDVWIKCAANVNVVVWGGSDLNSDWMYSVRIFVDEDEIEKAFGIYSM